MKKNIPVISPGKKYNLGNGHFTPPVCCALTKTTKLGMYSTCYGTPKIIVKTNNKKITDIKILRGSPCGSTWRASLKFIGHSLKTAPTQFGLEIQRLCTASSNFFNPLIHENPIHIAAKIHKKALELAINNK